MGAVEGDRVLLFSGKRRDPGRVMVSNVVRTRYAKWSQPAIGKNTVIPFTFTGNDPMS
jgi:hypothetical protein